MIAFSTFNIFKAFPLVFARTGKEGNNQATTLAAAILMGVASLGSGRIRGPISTAPENVPGGEERMAVTAIMPPCGTGEALLTN